jgi:thymidylate kinase
MSQKAFGGDQGIGTPEKPLHRRDKNVTSWPVTVIRFFFYLADVLNLWLTVQRLKVTKTDVVVFDRYIYDELANLPLNHWPTRVFVRLLLKVIPRPEPAFLIDADPVAARARKPEYPLEFLRRNRESYLVLSRMIPNMVVIEPQSIDSAEAKMRAAVSVRLLLTQPGLPAPSLRAEIR